MSGVVVRALMALRDAGFGAQEPEPSAKTEPIKQADQPVSQGKTGKGLCPGPALCGGCYSVGMVDGKERFLHPPRGESITWPKLATERVQ